MGRAGASNPKANPCLDPSPDLVDRKANGLHVLAEAPLPATVFLHQRQDKTAPRFSPSVVTVIIDLIEADFKLGVNPERR